MSLFLSAQTKEQVAHYKDMLATAGAFSGLYSENDKPFLHYRAAENIFCRAFGAENKSRSDIAIDAVKNNVGIGIKTFLFRNSQFEKVAEFNKKNNLYSSLSPEELVNYIVDSRNARIDYTTNMFTLSSNIYHCIARDENKFIVYEVPMAQIDKSKISNITVGNDGKVVNFTDGHAEYKFNKTKSTLYMKFIPPSDVLEFPVRKLANPYEAISALAQKNNLSKKEMTTGEEDSLPYVILPLYSPGRHGDQRVVKTRSGLNMWNALGRPRHPDEVYIIIPSWIHTSYPGFFPPRNTIFELSLPDGTNLSGKVTQAGAKGLASNPNKELGNWILRKVLKLKPGTLVTYELLEKIDIDSVAVYKLDDEHFSIEFKKLGSYEEFVAKTAAIS